MEITVRSEAVKLFNETWDLIDLKERTREENAAMLHKAHTSRYLWGLIGEPKNFARGEWQVSRVYALLNMAEAALLHGEISLKIAIENNLEGLDLAFGYEAVARAKAILGDISGARENKAKGLEEAAKLEKEGDRKYTEGELNGINCG
ncbi:MAG: hypothetical protein FWD82_04090 [Defluviitaleaceae bacterium]|nr:hypothetical protein [Defluviitaleaceae bacterium]